SALGLADVERKTPIREDTIFRAYSMSKPITSVAFMTLVEQGLVALDTPVHQVIPEWENLGVYQAGFMETFQVKRPERPMLMIDLLRHTSGLTYGFQQTTNVDAAYRKLKIGEREGGEPFDEYLRSRIFKPLGMTDTDFFVRAGNQPRFSACYAVTPKTPMMLFDDPARSVYLQAPSLCSGGGGLVTTAAD